MDLFSLFAKISLDTSEYDKGLDTAAKKLHEVGKSMFDTGKTLTKWVTAPVAGLGTAIIKTGADYEASMSKVQAISGATAADMAMLGDEAMRMAAQTKFSTSESAEAYQYMAMAGWDAQQMVDGLSGIMLLASASGESLASTSDIVTDALTAFGLKAGDSGRFADVLAAASNSANTNVSMLGESFKYVAPMAGALGYSVEDTSIALGLMANSGIKSSQAGTTLRSALTRLISPSKDAATAMEEYGISMQNTDGSTKTLMEVMEMLRGSFGDMGIEITTADGELKNYSQIMEEVKTKTGEGSSELDRLAAISKIFGQEAMPGMLSIIQSAPEDFNKLTEAIYNSSGTTEEMAAIMNDNAAGAMAMLSSAINVLFTNLSEFLIPAFTEIVRKATEVVNWFNQLDAGTQHLILTIAGIAAVVGPVLIVVGKIVSAIGTIASGIGGLIGVIGKAGTAVKGLFAILAANPIAAVIAAVAALAAGIVVLWNTNEDFRNAVGAIWEAIKGFFVGAWEAIKAAWESAGDFFGGIIDGIKGAFEGIGEFLGGLFTSAWELVQGAWNVAVGFFTEIGNGIQSVFEAVTGFLGDVFSAAWDVVSGVWEAATGFFGGIWDNIKGTASKAADSIGGSLKKAWEAVKGVWNGAVSFFSGIAGNIINTFTSLPSKFLSVGGDIVNGLKNGIANAWSSFIGWLNDKVGGIVNGVKAMLGIHSPSTVFAGIGENMALGLAAGWEDQYSSIKKKIEGGMDFAPVSVGVTGNYTGTYGGMGGQTPQNPVSRGGDTFNFYSPKALDPVSAAREMRKAKQQMALGYV